MRRPCRRWRSASRAGRKCWRSRSGPCPIPGDGEILVAVAAAGVNRPDVMQRKGQYPPPPGAPDIPGLEISGLVARVGERRRRASRRATRSWRWCRAAATPNSARSHESTALPLPEPLTLVEGGGHPGDDLHRLAQRLRARRAPARRVAARAWRDERHRHHRDPARQGLRRLRRGDRRLRREMRARRSGSAPTSAVNYKTRGFRRGGEGGDARPWRRRHPRHGRRRLSRRAISTRSAEEGRIVQISTLAGPKTSDRSSPRHDEAR